MSFSSTRRGRQRLTVRELGLTLLAGALLGLAATQVPGLLAPPGAASFVPASLEKADPWRESRRSREILETQEGAYAPPLEAGLPGAAADVIDGDTFRFRGEKIRIADIDTPETHSPRCAYEAELGARATRRLAQLLGEGSFALQSSPDGRDVDRYGRKLRVVLVGGRSVGDVLVEEGLARYYEGRRRPWCG